MPAGMARGHFALKILQKTIGEVVLVVCTSSRLHARLAAVRAMIFNEIFLGIAI